MKKLITAIFLVLVGSSAVRAQCGKKIILLASKTEHLDSTGALQQVIEEKSIIEITKTDISVTPGNEDKVSGPILSDSCLWKIPFKEGKTVIKAVITDQGGDTKHLTFTIEGKAGKVIVLVEAKEMDNRKIRITADSFEEKK